LLSSIATCFCHKIVSVGELFFWGANNPLLPVCGVELENIVEKPTIKKIKVFIT